MLGNYLTVAIRNLFRNKVYSFINVLGLAIGMAGCILAFAFIRYERSWDRFHYQADHIYRVLWSTPSDNLVIPVTCGPLGPALKAEFHEVEEAVRLWPDRVWVRTPNDAFSEMFCLTDPSIFRVFTLPLLKGDSSQVFRNPFSIVVTETAAKKCFGNSDPIGKTVTVESRIFGGDYVVTGVLKDIPQNSSSPVHFDYLTNTRSQDEPRQDWDKWLTTAAGGRNIHTFVTLRSPKYADGLAAKFPDFLRRHMGDDMAAKYACLLQPLTDIHLYSARKYNLRQSMGDGDIETLYQVGGIAFLILAIACINFVNLSTARAGTRQKEIGVRKTLGSRRTQLFAQFSLESTVLAGAALILSLCFTDLTFPVFRNYIGHDLPENFSMLAEVLPFLPFLVISVAFLTGAYPAVVLSSFDPVRVLKASSKLDVRGGSFRKILVLWQFIACILLITGTIVMYEQTRFLKERKLGFDRDLIITMPIFSMDRARKPDWTQHLSYQYRTLKATVLSNPNIVKASAYRWPPGLSSGITRVIETDGKQIHIPVIEGDEDFLNLFDIPLVAGRNFNPVSLYAIKDREFLLNESAVKRLGWKDPIGKPFNWRDAGNQKDGIVVGVVRDFHTESLAKPIGPVAIFYQADLLSHLGVKVKPDRIDETITFLKKTWNRFLPERPFEYAFLDESLHQLYQQEEQTTRLIGTFSILTILLGCMGLFGLTSFAMERRRKEIGIRRVLGASVFNILLLLSKEFVVLIVGANLIAWPVGLYLLTEWLNRFAYRIDLHIGYFVLAGLTALAIALVTVSFQATKAARSNPVDALRYE